MAKHIFITATNTEIGKTYTTIKLMQALTKMGYAVGVVKPIETGVDPIAEDGMHLLETLKTCNPKARHLEVKDIVGVTYPLPAAPYVAKTAAAIDWDTIDGTVQAMDGICDICLIEGAGGLLVPVDAGTDMIDVIKRYDAKALLVSHCRLGCINDTRLSIEALSHRGIDYEWVLNCRDDDNSFDQISRPYFDSEFPDYMLLSKDLERLCTRLLI